MERDDCLCAVFKKDTLCAETCVDVGVDDCVGVFQDFLRTIGKDDFGVVTAHLFVEGHIVHTGEGVLDFTKGVVHFLFSEDVGVGVDTLFVKSVKTHKVIAHFVAGV